jgi:hypothetical protein
MLSTYTRAVMRTAPALEEGSDARQTTAQITEAGRAAIDAHLARLEAMKKAAADWPRSWLRRILPKRGQIYFFQK